MTTVAFCAFIAIFAAVFWLLPDSDFSEAENRELALVPSAEAEKIFSGEFADEMNVYFADQFPLRDIFVKIKSGCELAFLKGENNGVLFSPEQLAVRSFDAYGTRLESARSSDYFYSASVKAQLERVNLLAEGLDVPLITLFPPRSVDIAESSFGYKLPYGETLFALCEETLSEKAGFVPLLEDMRADYEKGEYVIYKTDHHWTSEGAYIAYRKIALRLGCEAVSLQELEKTEIYGFYGTTAARAEFPFCPEDTVTLYRGSKNFTVVADGVELCGMFDTAKAETSDKYSVFLGGTHGITEIYAEGEREVLLVVKDSFANCLIPFLAENYNIVALDLRSNPDISAAAERYNASAVIIVWNAENLITDSALGNLR